MSFHWFRWFVRKGRRLPVRPFRGEVSHFERVECQFAFRCRVSGLCVPGDYLFTLCGADPDAEPVCPCCGLRSSRQQIDTWMIVPPDAAAQPSS